MSRERSRAVAQKSDLSKASKSVYTKQNLRDAKKSEALDLLLHLIRRKTEMEVRKKKLQGARLNDVAGVDEMMTGGRIMELDRLISWISAKHPGAAKDAKVLDL